jgi:hypothetical protein
MTDRERRMYRILGAVSATDAPIVFVGGLITKLILAENGFAAIDRPTVDIDANWVGSPPSMSFLVDTINRALKAVDGEELYAEAKREYDDRQAAGLYIIEAATGDRIVTMDIDVRPVGGSRVYYYGEIGIRGILPTEILADKIAVLSSNYIFRRGKDLMDVYALAHCVSLSAVDIYDTLERKKRRLGTFIEFRTCRRDVEHAYDMLRGIEGKPCFSEVYPYLEKFLLPFILKERAPRTWNPHRAEWDREFQITEK